MARASRVLFFVADHPAGATAGEVAAGVGLNISTAHHLLATLAGEGLLAKDETRRFQLGPRVAALADAYLGGGALPGYLQAPLTELARATGETAYLIRWSAGEVVVLASVAGANAVRVAEIERGPYRHAHARAGGKVLLAFARAELRESYLRTHPLEPQTPKTVTDRAELDRQLDAIRRQGWAEERDEFVTGVSCVAAPALTDGAVIATFTVSAPTVRYRSHRAELRAAVLAAARQAAPGHEERSTA